MTKNRVKPSQDCALKHLVIGDTPRIVLRVGKSEYTLLVLTAAAVALPLIWAHQAPPLPAFFSQWLADLLWPIVAAVALGSTTFAALPHSNSLGQSDDKSYGGNDGSRFAALQWMHLRRTHGLVVSLWMLLIATVLLHVAFNLTPVFVALPAAFNLLLAAVITGAVLTRRMEREFLRVWLRAFLLGVMLAACFNAGVALVQSVAPNWTDEAWIASVASSAPGQGAERASGNLRQPNQLATLMIWGLLAATFLLRRRPVLWLAISLPLLVTLFATGSRVGMMSLVLIAVAALTRSRRARAWPRAAWLTAGLIALVLLWFAVSAFTRTTAEPALAQRLALWRDVWTLIQESPWRGVGWGQLNFAWTLTPLPARAPDVFDHAHCLPLHLAAELGLPLAAGVLALLGLALWRARSAARSREGATVLLMLATILLHSLFEYPLWFAYFLLPSAFLLAWFVCAGVLSLDRSLAAKAPSNATSQLIVAPGTASTTAISLAATAISIACIAVAIYAWKEYRKITAIYSHTTNANALGNAVAEARKSSLYGQFGDYTAIMIAGERAQLAWFDRPIRQVLDERLLTAYAQALARAGEADKAAFVVARAREFPPQPVFASLPVIAPSDAASAPLTPRDFRR